MEAQGIAVVKSRFSEMFPIVGSHFQRIGIVRTAAGGLSMYLCIPTLVLINLTAAVALYQWLLAPLLGLPRVLWRDHVVIDRHRIEGLSWFDKFNCMFCGYANGLCTMINLELDHLARFNAPIAGWKKPFLFLFGLISVPTLLLWELNVQIVYNLLVSLPLGMHRTSIAEANSVLAADRYAAQFPALPRANIRVAKNIFLRFSLALEQIESSWCPLVHFERRNGIVYPDHHERFFGPHEIDAMRQVLSTVGTVSERKPLY